MDWSRPARLKQQSDLYKDLKLKEQYSKMEVTGAGAPEAVALELASRALGITVARLDEIVRWNEEYMRWHDGQAD